MIQHRRLLNCLIKAVIDHEWSARNANIKKWHVSFDLGKNRHIDIKKTGSVKGASQFHVMFDTGTRILTFEGPHVELVGRDHNAKSLTPKQALKLVDGMLRKAYDLGRVSFFTEARARHDYELEYENGKSRSIAL